MRRKTTDIILVLSDAMKSIVSTFSKSRFFPSGLVKRASIVLLVFVYKGDFYYVSENQEEDIGIF